MIELNNNNPKQCNKCIHDRVCSLKEKLKAYIEEYDVLNEKYGDLFPKNPTCPEYLSNGAVNRHYHEIPNADDILRKFKEEPIRVNKSETPKSKLNFIDENECCNRKELNEEDFIKTLERILRIG